MENKDMLLKNLLVKQTWNFTRSFKPEFVNLWLVN